MRNIPLLKGDNLFQGNELIYINRSDELQDYNGVMHKHDFIEIAYVIEGEGIHAVGDSRYEVSRGDIVIINYDIPHGFLPKEGRKKLPVVYNCAFKPEFLDASLISSSHFEDITSSFLLKSLFPEDFAPGPDIKLKDADFNEVGEIFRKMYTEYKLKKKGCYLILRAHLIELVVKIFRYMEKESKSKAVNRNSLIVESAVEYLKSNYNTDVKLEDIALQSFISKNYFSRLFKEITGINFSDYVQKLRISEACRLLKETDMKIVDIASSVGINDIKFFYKVFRKVTGKTPGDYRK